MRCAKKWFFYNFRDGN